MRTRKLLGLLSIAAMLTLSCTACAQDAPSIAFPDTAGRGSGGYIDEMFSRMDKLAEDYAPKITTLPNGVQIQRTPNEDANPGGGAWLAGNTISYNTYFLDSDNRGCGACHSDLAETLANMPFKHLELRNSMGLEATVDQCLFCHSTNAGKYYFTENFGFGQMMHGIHVKSDAFKAMKGDCMSCHAATEDGNGMQLWDMVKHNWYRGIVDYPEFEAEFSFTQEKIIEDNKDLFYVDWMYGDGDYNRWGAEKDALPLDEDLFNNWVLTVCGDVEKPTTFKLTDLIANAPSVTQPMTQACIINPTGGPLLYTTKVTGIPISWLLDQVGVKEGANFMHVISIDGFEMSFPLSYGDSDDSLVVYELNGEKLSYAIGYPLLGWISGLPSSNDPKALSEIRITTEENAAWANKPKYHMPEGGPRSAGFYTQANVGVAHLNEGQIIPAYEPHTFEGYAYAFDGAITALEFSLDRGKTWKTYPVENADFNRWVWWNFTFTPETEGAFVFMVRAVDSYGNTTEVPREFMLNAK